MPRGGRRAGAPGKSYSNRRDLNQTRTLPVARIPNQTYGVQAQQVAAQKSVPVATRGVPAGGGSSAPPVTATGTPLIPLDAPTMRPNEPLTAGVDIGPGPGAPPDPTVNPRLPSDLILSLELLATLPDASDATRYLVRRLRSRL